MRAEGGSATTNETDRLEGANLLKPSGRGVFPINQMTDTVECAEQGRLVMMRKRRDPAPGP